MDQVTAVLQGQKGDKDSFRFLVESYQGKALSTAFFLTQNHYTAEDVVQEAFVQCYLHLSELRNPAQFKWWFYRILTRIAWRKKGKDDKSVPIADIFPAKEKELNAAAGHDSLVKEETGEILTDALNLLDTQHKTVLILYYFNDFSVQEISQILNCPEGTVKSRLYHGRQKLKEKLLQKADLSVFTPVHPGKTTDEEEVSL